MAKTGRNGKRSQRTEGNGRQRSKSTATKNSDMKGPVDDPDGDEDGKRRLDSEDGYIILLQEELERRQKANAKYSLRRFAEDLGVHNGVMSRTLTGTRPLSHKTAFRIMGRLSWDAKRKGLFLESLERQARQLDGGAVSLERAKRDKIGVVESMSNFVARRQHLDSVRSDIVLENNFREDPSKGAIKQARAAIDRSLKRNCRHGRFVITCAVGGAKVDAPFLASIKTFLDDRDAELFILPLRPHLKALDDQEYPLDRILHEEFGSNIFRNVELNDYLTAATLDVKPQATDPLSGIQELGAAEGRSFIVAHTQQRLKTYPNGLEAIARAQICTGAVTAPLYGNSKAGLLGDKRHVVGALIVEIHRDTFHARHVQADADGSFIDLGVRYTPDGKVVSGESERPEALVRGDDHGGPEIFGDPIANAVLDEVTRLLRPRRIFIHDLFDAASVSHHRERSISAKINVPDAARTLQLELEASRRFLEHLGEVKPKDCTLYVVGSNHNEHLSRYLDDGRWAKQIDHNYKMALDLAHKYHIHGLDPLKQGIDPGGDRAHWLGRNEVIKVEGITLSHHGDLGPNGSRGSVRGDLTSFGKSIAGHSHSPEIFRSAIRVGTTSRLQLDYNVGPSSWAHCFALVYKGGMSQLVIVVDGMWCLDDKGGVARKKVAKNARKSAKTSLKKKRRK